MALEEPLTLPGSSDEEIVARVRAGDCQLFEAIMRRHNTRIYRAARAILGDDHEAEDVMQDAYVRAYEHLHEFEGRARFATWLTRIAVHEALARVRRRRRLDPLDSHSEEPSMITQSELSPEQLASDGEMHAVLEHAIDALPDDFRSVLVLRLIEGLSGAETAECLGIPEETVKTRLYRARGRLQEMLMSAMDPVLPRTYDFPRTRCDRVVDFVMRRISSGICRI